MPGISSIRGYVLLLIAAAIPFMPKWISVAIIVQVILWLVEGDIKNKFRAAFANKTALLMIAFYLFHAVGLLWSDNLKYGSFDMQIKLSLLVFPLVLFGGSLPRNASPVRLLNVFAGACVTAILICFTRAVYLDVTTGHSDYYFYTYFSWFIHPGYFAMYLGLASAWMLVSLKNNYGESKSSVNILKIVSLVILTAAVVVLASKAGIFIQLMILVSGGISLMMLKKNLFSGFLVFLVAAFLVVFGMFVPVTSGRMMELENTLSSKASDTTMHTTTNRLDSWKSAVILIKEHPLVGTGTGDVKDQLLQTYRKYGYMDNYQKQLNAHNQYLQTTVALGIVGVLILVFMFLIGFINSLKSKNYMLLYFILIVSMNAMTESVLEVSAGVVFFAFFYPVIMFFIPEKKQSIV